MLHLFLPACVFFPFALVCFFGFCVFFCFFDCFFWDRVAPIGMMKLFVLLLFFSSCCGCGCGCGGSSSSSSSSSMSRMCGGAAMRTGFSYELRLRILRVALRNARCSSICLFVGLPVLLLSSLSLLCRHHDEDEEPGHQMGEQHLDELDERDD